MDCSFADAMRAPLQQTDHFSPSAFIPCDRPLRRTSVWTCGRPYNYNTYKAYWSLLEKIEEDPKYDEKKAKSLLKKFVDLHDHTIANKAAIMVEHFADRVANRIKGKAKAMIVTRSRLHAVRYKQQVARQTATRYPILYLQAEVSGLTMVVGHYTSFSAD
ncbi:hypothetical protein ACFL2Q_17755 [Thermodesulfobacteriota bacterium]